MFSFRKYFYFIVFCFFVNSVVVNSRKALPVLSDIGYGFDIVFVLPSFSNTISPLEDYPMILKSKSFDSQDIRQLGKLKYDSPFSCKYPSLFNRKIKL